MMKRFTATILVITLITATACSELTGEFKFMNDLKNSISEKYETEEVEVKMKNDNELVVVLIDSKFDNYSSVQKAQISREIGNIAQQLRKDKEKLKLGLVKFRQEENYGITKTSDTESYQMYE